MVIKQNNFNPICFIVHSSTKHLCTYGLHAYTLGSWVQVLVAG